MKKFNGKAIIHLNLHRRWFDAILSGGKREEYREIKKSWNMVFGTPGKVRYRGRFYDYSDVAILFSNGYKKNRPQMLFALENVSIGIGKSEWGAPSHTEVYRLRLGKKLNQGITVEL